MECPNCETYLSWDWLTMEGIEANVSFECPQCRANLRYCVDEGTYYGAQHQHIELVDE